MRSGLGRAAAPTRTTGSAIVTVEPVGPDAAAVALGGRPDDRQAEPRARRARARPAAPEAVEGGLLGRPGRSPRPASVTGDLRLAVLAARARSDLAAGGPVDARRSRAGCSSARASASGSPLTVTGPSTSATHAARAPPPTSRDQLGRAGPARCGARRRALALQRQQVARPAGASRAASLCEVGDHLRVGAVAGEVLDVADQRGQRRAQLVAGVGEEAALALARGVERRRASRSASRASSPTSCRAGRLGQPPRRRRRCARSPPPRRRGRAAARCRAGSGAPPRRRRASDRPGAAEQQQQAELGARCPRCRRCWRRR